MTIGFSPLVIAFMVVSMLAVGHARQGPDIGLPVPSLGVGPFEFDTAEKQKIRVTGLVRPDDISSDNTIPSWRVADANIQLLGDGILTKKARPGVLTWLLSLFGE